MREALLRNDLFSELLEKLSSLFFKNKIGKRITEPERSRILLKIMGSTLSWRRTILARSEFMAKQINTKRMAGNSFKFFIRIIL